MSFNRPPCPKCGSRLKKHSVRVRSDGTKCVRFECPRLSKGECTFRGSWDLQENDWAGHTKTYNGLVSLDGEESSKQIDEQDEELVKGGYKYSEDEDKAEFDGTIQTTETDRVKILDEFLELCKVDLKTWEVDRYVLNAWDTTMKLREKVSKNEYKQTPITKTNYQIKVWLKRKEAEKLAMENFIQKLYEKKIEVPQIALRKIIGDNMFEISMFDHHFGKLSWHVETNENYDLKIAKDIWREAINEHRRYAETHNPSQILFPIGNDLLHIDNAEGSTNRGTRQDVEGRLAKIYDVAFESIIESIALLKTIAPVHIVWVASNHDLWVTYFLCKTIWAYYSNDKNVTFDIACKSRKAYKWGKNFIGYEHGELKPEQTPLLFADEWRKEWVETNWREIHCGHHHKTKTMVFTSVDTIGSIIYRKLPSLTRTDYWHYKQGFVNKVKCTDAFVWNKENGMIDNYHIYI